MDKRRANWVFKFCETRNEFLIRKLMIIRAKACCTWDVSCENSGFRWSADQLFIGTQTSRSLISALLHMFKRKERRGKNLREERTECKTSRDDTIEPLKTEFPLVVAINQRLALPQERCIWSTLSSPNTAVCTESAEACEITYPEQSLIVPDAPAVLCWGVFLLWANLLIRPTTRCARWPRRPSSVTVTAEQIPCSFFRGVRVAAPQPRTGDGKKELLNVCHGWCSTVKFEWPRFQKIKAVPRSLVFLKKHGGTRTPNLSRLFSLPPNTFTSLSSGFSVTLSSLFLSVASAAKFPLFFDLHLSPAPLVCSQGA